MFESTAHQSLFKAKSCTTRFGIIFTRKAKTIYMSINTSTESNDQRQVSICLIFIYWRFSVQFMTPTSQFTPFESNDLVYRLHPRFLTQNFGKKVRLIHEFLRYLYFGCYKIILSCKRECLIAFLLKLCLGVYLLKLLYFCGPLSRFCGQ